MFVLTVTQPVIDATDAPDTLVTDDTPGALGSEDKSNAKDAVSNHSTPSVLKALQEAGLQNGQQAREQPGPQGLAQQELQLADIHLAAKPSIWPPAPGWWILFFLVLGLISFSFMKLIRYRRIKKHQKRLLNAMDQLEKKFQREQSTEALSNINLLLRRLALAYYPRKKIASLTGQQWLHFLDQSGHTKDFSQGAGKLLAEAPYLANLPNSADINGLNSVVKKWVKHISSQPRARAALTTPIGATTRTTKSVKRGVAS